MRRAIASNERRDERDTCTPTARARPGRRPSREATESRLAQASCSQHREPSRGLDRERADAGELRQASGAVAKSNRDQADAEIVDRSFCTHDKWTMPWRRPWGAWRARVPARQRWR